MIEYKVENHLYRLYIYSGGKQVWFKCHRKHIVSSLPKSFICFCTIKYHEKEDYGTGEGKREHNDITTHIQRNPTKWKREFVQDFLARVEIISPKWLLAGTCKEIQAKHCLTVSLSNGTKLI